MHYIKYKGSNMLRGPDFGRLPPISVLVREDGKRAVTIESRANDRQAIDWFKSSCGLIGYTAFNVTQAEGYAYDDSIYDIWRRQPRWCSSEEWMWLSVAHCRSMDGELAGVKTVCVSRSLASAMAICFGQWDCDIAIGKESIGMLNEDEFTLTPSGIIRGDGPRVLAAPRIFVDGNGRQVLEAIASVDLTERRAYDSILLLMPRQCDKEDT